MAVLAGPIGSEADIEKLVQGIQEVATVGHLPDWYDDHSDTEPVAPERFRDPSEDDGFVE